VFDLTHFTMSDMTRLARELRDAASGAASMQEVAEREVRLLFDRTRAPGGEQPACALVRFYKTHRLGGLTPPLQAFANGLASGAALSPDVKCLTLLATAGIRPEWNAPAGSRGHQAIPLVSEEMVRGAPMISQLITQFGLEVATVLSPQPELMEELGRRSYNVFFVPQAAGSSSIPAQDFVARENIASVLGIGGMLPSGDLYSIVLFSRVSIPPDVAEMFKTVALNVKLSILPFETGQVFAQAA
jgi:hypothetical protein